MRRGLALAGGFAALLLLLAWTVPRAVDWNARRGELAALSAERLGRTVTLEGPVRLVLLPQPVLEAQGVTLGGEGEDLAIGARALLLRLDLGALLTGRILPREVALVGAEIRLPWPPAPTAPLRPPPWLAALDARIEDSRLLVGDLVTSERARGATVIIATHHPATTAPSCDVAAHLEGGRVVWTGHPSDAPAIGGPDLEDGT
jgi:hypothetical protein